jgi:hypothetical protein
LSCAFLFCLALLLHVAPHFLCLNAPLHYTTPCCFISWPISSPCLVVLLPALLFWLALLLHLALLLPLMPCCFTSPYYFALLRYLLQLLPPCCFDLHFALLLTSCQLVFRSLFLIANERAWNIL